MKAVIDVREWQTAVDMKTGYPCEFDGPLADRMRQIASEMPYPGDDGLDGINWVFDGAEELISLNDPQLLCLNFTYAYFAGLNRLCEKWERKKGVKRIFEVIKEISEKYDFKPIIIGTGSKVKHIGTIENPDTKGVLQSTAWTHNMAGIYHAEPGDLETVKNTPHIKEAVLKKDILDKAGNDMFVKHFPDILLKAEEGWSFKGVFGDNIPYYNLEKEEEKLPVYSEIGNPEHTEDVNSLMRAAVEKGDKVLLAIVEGVDGDDFEYTCLMDNRRDWYTYGGY